MQHLRLVRCAYVPRRLRVLRQLLMEQQQSLKYAVSELRRHRLCWPHLAVQLPKNVHPRTPRCARSSTGTQRVALQGAAKRGQGSAVREWPGNAQKNGASAREHSSAAVAGGCRELATAELWLTSDSRRRPRMLCAGVIGPGISPAAAVAGHSPALMGEGDGSRSPRAAARALVNFERI